MEDPEVDRIRTAYLERLRRILKRAPYDVREDALREVQTHIEDEWRALGGDLSALRTVLERMGSPETYGRDLALQLMLLQPAGHRSPGRLFLAGLFWASSSLVGAAVVLSAAMALGYGLGMVVVAFERWFGNQMALIDAPEFQLFGNQSAPLRFPPDAWSPMLVTLAGLLPVVVVFAGLYRFYTLWVRSGLARRGLALVSGSPASTKTEGWERRAVWAMLVIAGVGLAGCVSFSLISGLVPVGRPAMVSLPEDFFQSPLTMLAFLGGLVFLCSPVLGLLWAARRALIH